MYRVQCMLVVALLVGLAHSWDIAVTVEDRIEFYTDNGTKIDTNRLITKKCLSFGLNQGEQVSIWYDVTGLKRVLIIKRNTIRGSNLTALVYNEVHNMLLYVDKQNNNDAICGYSISYGEYKCYVERNGRNIQGLAFDPVTETLFFTDIKERSINWFSFKPESKNNVYGNLLIKMDDGIPTDIAVDSCRGYIYWINTILLRSRIERARFDGSDREVVINAEFKVYQHDMCNLAIDQQMQKMIWLMPETSSHSPTYGADLNGQNSDPLISWSTGSGNIHPNAYTFSKQYLYAVGCSACSEKVIFKFPKIRDDRERIFKVYTAGVIGIAANYKMKDHFQGISVCRHVLNNYERDDSFKIAKEYEGPYCVHGTKVNGQSLCKCTPGYTGDRCEVSVCGNYCLHGNCSFTEQGLPKCRCEAGYSGERCEVNACNGYCSNNGTCSFDDDSQPICQCQGDYMGRRCEISGCVNYCFKGNCSLNEEGLPECRCDAGYTGERCEMSVCYQYCSNDGTCSLNEEDEPVCECVGEYEGERCEVLGGLNNGDGSLNPGDSCQFVMDGKLIKIRASSVPLQTIQEKTTSL